MVLFISEVCVCIPVDSSYTCIKPLKYYTYTVSCHTRIPLIINTNSYPKKFIFEIYQLFLNICQKYFTQIYFTNFSNKRCLLHKNTTNTLT